MTSLILALVSYIGWGTGDVFGAIASRKIGAFSTTLWVFITAVVLSSLYIPFDQTDLSQYSAQLLLLNIVLGILYIAGNVTFNIALTSTNVSVVTTIGGSFSAFVVILSYIFLKESVSLFQWIIIAIIYIGVVLCTINFNEIKSGKIVQDKGIFFALVSMILWGVYFTFIKIIMGKIGWFWPTYISLILFPIIFIFMRLANNPIINPVKKQTLLPVVASGILLRMGDFSFNIGGLFGFTSIVAPVAGAYPTLTAILGHFVFRDPITKQQVIGIIISLIGIVLLGIFTIYQ